MHSEILEAIFGRWPTFHDAEVVQVRLDRGKQATDGTEPPTMEIDVHIFEMTDEVGPRGPYVHRNHTLTTLLFKGIDQVHMDEFNQQNVLFDLEMERGPDPERPAWTVALQPPFGLGGSFTCEEIEVLQAVPFRPPDRLLET